jgi:hypothetical protein
VTGLVFVTCGTARSGAVLPKRLLASVIVVAMLLALSGIVLSIIG